MQEIIIKKIDEIDQIFELKKYEGWVFRGLPEAKYDLIPSLYRPKGDYVYRLNKNDLSKYLKKSYELIVAHDAHKLKYLKHPDDSPKNRKEFMSFLQHNGHPSPVLDWTYSPGVAVYFAAIDGWKTLPFQDHDINSYMVVYAANKTEIDKNSTGKTNVEFIKAGSLFNRNLILQ